MSNFAYEYSPFTSQDGKEIPNFEIFSDGVKVAETNENLPSDEQEWMAILFTNSHEMMELLREVYPLYTTSERFDTDWASRTSTLLKKLDKL